MKKRIVAIVMLLAIMATVFAGKEFKTVADAKGYTGYYTGAFSTFEDGISSIQIKNNTIIIKGGLGKGKTREAAESTIDTAKIKVAKYKFKLAKKCKCYVEIGGDEPRVEKVSMSKMKKWYKKAQYDEDNVGLAWLFKMKKGKVVQIRYFY